MAIAKLLKVILQPSDHLLLQKDLDSFYNRSLVNELCFGIPKCVLLSFNNKFSTSYHIESNMLSSQSEHWDLAIQMSTDLSWSTHYSIICSKAYKCLGLLRRMFGKFGSVEARWSLYLALVCSQLSYCSQLWKPHLIKDTTTLERVQRGAKSIFWMITHQTKNNACLTYDSYHWCILLIIISFFFQITKAAKQSFKHLELCNLF